MTGQVLKQHGRKPARGHEEKHGEGIKGNGARRREAAWRERARGGWDDGILSELKCDVRGCDGSVNSNKSHILCLSCRLVRELWT